MGMTMIEKILARAAGHDKVSAGETVVCSVDMSVVLDLQFGLGWIEPLSIVDSDRVAVIMDHAVPSPSRADANNGIAARRFVDRFGIEKFYDIGRHGICHQVIAENALALPGQVLACTDSHTCAAAGQITDPREVLQ